MSADWVRTRVEDNLLYVTLNRADKRNALTIEFTEAIGAAIRSADEHPQVRAVIVEAEGPIFSAGLDVMSLAQARSHPVTMMESGPVAGMIGAGALARHLNLGLCIGFDMGGTTAKSSLIINGEPAIEEGYVIGDHASGQPMQLPVVDIVEVGAGGGSIAWVDATGGLHVGPQSAGADPGPACYSKGNPDPSSPTPMSCSAASTRSVFSAARWVST